MDFNHLSNLQSVMDEAVSAKKVAGLNCLVIKDDKEIGYWQSGFADVENNQVFKRDTICRLFSMSKPVTAVAAWTLIEKGKIDLTDDISKFIPEFKDLTVCTEMGRNGKPQKANRVITVQDLLNMTSGYSYGAWNENSLMGEHLISDLILELNSDCDGECKISTVDVAKRLAKIPVSFEPGTNYCYGLSADILGAVIEVVSGMRFSDYLKKTIFNPLGMYDTDFYVPEEKQNRLASIYVCDDGKNVNKFASSNLGIQASMKNKPSFESGGAGLCSTLDDYLKFALMLLNGGEYNGTRILQKKTVEYFGSARLTKALQEKFDQNMSHLVGFSYCNLMRVCAEPGLCTYLNGQDEFGWDGWLGPYVSIDLKNKLIVLMMMQKTNAGTWELTRKMKNVIFSSIN